MVKNIIKNKNLKHYLFSIVVVVAVIFYYKSLLENPFEIPFETDYYFSETNKIKEGLNHLIKVACDTDEVFDEERWICGKNSFQVEDIEATKYQTFATGGGRAENGEEIVWVAIKNDTWWNQIWFDKKSNPYKCEEVVEEVDPKRFGEKFRYCVDENGRQIDRLIELEGDILN